MMGRRAFVLRAIGGAATFVAGDAMAAPRRPARPAPVPPGYVVAARVTGVPPLILYGVALQESQLRFGPHALPYPWTLNVRGEPRRYDTYEQSVAALRDVVTRGITRVDCGLMQINWHYHWDKLGAFWTAMDPYPNMAVGGQLLRQHYLDTGDWFKAVARYHNATPSIGERYAAEVFQRIARIPTPATAGVRRG